MTTHDRHPPPHPYYLLLIEQKATKKSKGLFEKKQDSFVQVLPGSLWTLGKSDDKKHKKYTDPSKSLLLANVEDPEIVLRCQGTDVAHISEVEFKYLIAVPQCSHRYKVHQDAGWVKGVLKLKTGSPVYVEINNPRTHAIERATGILRVIDTLPDERGIWFGVELDEKWRGCGTCSGEYRKKQIFTCDYPDSAVFVGVNKIRAVRRSHTDTDGAVRVPNGLPVEHNEFSNGSSPDLTPPPLKIGERVVWISDTGPEVGTVEWIGTLPDEPGERTWMVGVNFDNPIGTGTGRYHDQQLFKSNPAHASLIPIVGLIKAEEFYQGPEPARPVEPAALSNGSRVSVVNGSLYTGGHASLHVSHAEEAVTLDTGTSRTNRRTRSPYTKRQSTDNLIAEENAAMTLGNQRTTKPKQKDIVDYYKYSYQTDKPRSAHTHYGNQLTVNHPSSGSDTTTPDRSPLSSPHSPQQQHKQQHRPTPSYEDQHRPSPSYEDQHRPSPSYDETDPMYERLVDVKNSKVSTPSPTYNRSSPPSVMKGSQSEVIYAQVSRHSTPPLRSHHTDGALHHQQPPLSLHHPSPDLTRDSRHADRTPGSPRRDERRLKSRVENGYAEVRPRPVEHQLSSGNSSLLQSPNEEETILHGKRAGDSLFYVSLKGDAATFNQHFPSTDDSRYATAGSRHSRSSQNSSPNPRGSPPPLPLRQSNPRTVESVSQPRSGDLSSSGSAQRGVDPTITSQPRLVDPAAVSHYSSSGSHYRGIDSTWSNPQGIDSTGSHSRGLDSSGSNPRGLDSSAASQYRGIDSSTGSHYRGAVESSVGSHPSSSVSSPTASQADTPTEGSKRSVWATTLDPADVDSRFTINSMVEISSLPADRRYGMVRWMGRINDKQKIYVGLEMEEEHHSYTNGTFCGLQLFTCPNNKALYVPLDKLQPDKRFEETMAPRLSTSQEFGSMDCPDIEDNCPPPKIVKMSRELDQFVGQNKGIQGHHNSCYLDATLFSMFAFTTAFDLLLWRPKLANDIEAYPDVQHVLHKGIVNPLRKNFYVRADKVLKLRTLLDKLGSVQGMMTEEKDPEEFITSLLEQILKVQPFITLSSGQQCYMYQLIIEKDERITLPTTQQLLELSFYQTDIKLREEPRLLMLQMPRFGKDFKMYSKIIPSLYLDVTDILEYGPRECYVCGQVATYECRDCFKLTLEPEDGGLKNTCFCHDHCHSYHIKRPHHRPRPLEKNKEYEAFLQQRKQEGALVRETPLPRVELELFAVICIHTSHYVSFVKCGSGPESPWVFFDSMADRKGQENGYNIPEVSLCNFLPGLLLDSRKYTTLIEKDPKSLPEQMRRLCCDGYICLYQNKDLLPY